jgi:hypothetical protein
MKYYETFDATPKAPKPRQLQNCQDAGKIVKYLTTHFKTTHKDGSTQIIPLNKATAYMIAVADAIFDPKDWKAPIYAKFPGCGDAWAAAAIIWYHGARPLKSYIGVYSTGYAC